MKQEILQHLADAFGFTPEDAVELYDSYVTTIKDNFALLLKSVETNDMDTFARAAHSMKGCAMNSGHNAMAELSKSAEIAGKSRDSSAIKNAMDALTVEVNKLLQDQ